MFATFHLDSIEKEEIHINIFKIEAILKSKKGPGSQIILSTDSLYNLIENPETVRDIIWCHYQESRRFDVCADTNTASGRHHTY